MIGIGPRLKRERIRLKLSQNALGTIGGVETNAQGNYESGLRFPRADYLSRIAAAGVDVAYVITGETMPVLPGAGPKDTDLNHLIAGLHSNLHTMTQQLYQITQQLETRHSHNPSPTACPLNTLRDEAEAISLAIVRLIYVTSKLT